jgi:hypothetical protein
MAPVEQPDPVRALLSGWLSAVQRRERKQALENHV